MNIENLLFVFCLDNNFEARARRNNDEVFCQPDHYEKMFKTKKLKDVENLKFLTKRQKELES